MKWKTCAKLVKHVLLLLLLLLLPREDMNSALKRYKVILVKTLDIVGNVHLKYTLTKVMQRLFIIIQYGVLKEF